ncbi:MAG: class I SAM-dependent RNA methyltransferase [Leptospira sp.]|nr:class I SAM-dependent RNA methyltransferase [Leptospira sp.]
MEQIRIDSLSSDFLGTGIAPNGKKISYPYTLPGDLISVEMYKRKTRSTKYRLVEFLEKSERAPIPCQFYGECGGCAGQHIPYDDQCKIKFEPIQQLFSQLGVQFQTINSDQIFNYRSRMDFSVFPGPTIGLRARGNFRRVIDIDHCFIHSDWANKELANVRNLLNEFPQLPWDRNSERGGLKYITIRKARFTEDCMTIFTFTEGFQFDSDFANFKERTLELCIANHIIFCYNRVKSEVSAMGRSEILKGSDVYHEIVLGRDFLIPFDSFFQPNPSGFLPILEFIQSHLPENRNCLIDLFCGNGFFSILFGTSFSKIKCYELTPSSIEIAKNALHRAFPEKEILTQVVNLFQDASLMECPSDSVLILDPPRAGAGGKVNVWIRENGPRDIFYVSCNPYSQREDLKFYQTHYDVVASLLIDPYPHTPHCESVLHLRRKI